MELYHTLDIASGGMRLNGSASRCPDEGAEMAFELSMPPGAGYSVLAGKLRGTGQVTRALRESDGKVALGLRFTQPLALDF